MRALMCISATHSSPSCSDVCVQRGSAAVGGRLHKNIRRWHPSSVARGEQPEQSEARNGTEQTGETQHFTTFKGIAVVRSMKRRISSEFVADGDRIASQTRPYSPTQTQ